MSDGRAAEHEAKASASATKIARWALTVAVLSLLVSLLLAIAAIVRK